ncbi:MAG: recombinase family protein [Roseivirga sp.]
MEQDIEKNKAAMLHLCNEQQLGRLDFVEEVISGRVHWKKRKVGQIVSELRAGDVLIVSELSRLRRSMLECMEILSIAMEKELRVFAIKGNWQLDQSIQSKIVAVAFSMASEIERALLSERTKEALRTKKAQGIKLGRPQGSGKSKLDRYRPEIEALLAHGSTLRFIAQRYGTTQANLHNWLRKRGIKREILQQEATLSLELPMGKQEGN